MDEGDAIILTENDSNDSEIPRLGLALVDDPLKATLLYNERAACTKMTAPPTASEASAERHHVADLGRRVALGIGFARRVALGFARRVALGVLGALGIGFGRIGVSKQRHRFLGESGMMRMSSGTK